MQRLSALDATFLYLESPKTPMHAAGLQLFELPEGGGASFYEDLRKHLLERAHLIPLFHRHLHPTPLAFDHPVWIEDAGFDVDYHLRHLALPRPGGVRELTDLAEFLYPPLLDRSRPLWEYTVIDGLASGHAALYAKAHHACLDGMASQAMLDVFYSHSPDAPPPRAARAPRQEAEPSVLRSLGSAYAHVLGEPARALRALPGLGRSALRLARRAREGSLPPPAPRTRFDVNVTDRRRFAITSLSLARVKRIARACGATVNDVVLSLCGGALRRYLAAKGELPEQPLVAFVPISLRRQHDAEMNNQVFGMMTPLATDVADPVARLTAVHQAAATAKLLADDLREAVPSDYAFPGAPALIRALYGLLAQGNRPERVPDLFNLTISNVPGLQKPLYVSGAKLVAQYPMSIVQHGCALNITVMGILDSLDFGLVGCAHAVPDIDVLCAHLSECFDELERAVA